MKKSNKTKSTEYNKCKCDREKCIEKQFKEEESIITDPFGSWTGVSTDDIYATPIQDVDDL